MGNSTIRRCMVYSPNAFTSSTSFVYPCRTLVTFVGPPLDRYASSECVCRVNDLSTEERRAEEESTKGRNQPGKYNQGFKHVVTALLSATFMHPKGDTPTLPGQEDRSSRARPSTSSQRRGSNFIWRLPLFPGALKS
ncbi:hypothetical protein KM043_004044 [Ampulex compressa]|nr:hypothetical protein KM043_004044 [Ampulex compressa]